MAGFSTLGRDTSLVLCTQVYYRLSGIVILMVLSRKLSTSDIGVYFFALSFAEFFIVFAGLNQDTVMMRHVASDPDHAAAHVSLLLGFRIITSPLYLLCTLVVSMVLAPQVWLVVVVVSVFVLGESLYHSMGNLFIALKKVVYTLWIGIGVQTLFLLVFLAGMWWVPSLKAFIAANLIRSFGLLVAAAIPMRKRFRGLQPAWSMAFLQEGAPFALLGVTCILQEKVDTLLLGFLVDYEAVAHYSLAMRIVAAVSFVPYAMGAVSFPHLAAEKNKSRIRFLLIRGAGLLGAIGLATAAMGYVWAEPLTGMLYGSHSGAVARLFHTLTPLIPIQFVMFFLAVSLQALRQERKVLAAQALGTASSILLYVTLIPAFSVQGAIAARLLSSSLQLLLLAGYAWRLFSAPASRVPMQRD